MYLSLSKTKNTVRAINICHTNALYYQLEHLVKKIRKMPNVFDQHILSTHSEQNGNQSLYRFCLVRNRTPPIVVLRSPNQGKARFLWSHCGLKQCSNLYYDVGELKYLYMYLYRENGVHFIDDYYHVAWQGVNS